MSNINYGFCPNGHSVPLGSIYCPICGAPIVSSSLDQEFLSGSYDNGLLGLPRAQAGARFIEWLIDYGMGLVLSVATAGIGFLLFVCFFFVNAWHEGSTGQTLGKKIMNLYVIDSKTGSFIGGASGIGRHLLHFLDALPLGLGYLVGLVTGRTFADRIMGTVVVAKTR
jgi:uncharacterized RDD family membrane protein YckC